MKTQNVQQKQSFGSIYFKKPAPEKLEELGQAMANYGHKRYSGEGSAMKNVKQIEKLLDKSRQGGYVIQDAGNGYSRLVGRDEDYEVERALGYVEDIFKDAEFIPDRSYNISYRPTKAHYGNSKEVIKHWGYTVKDLEGAMNRGWLDAKKVQESFNKVVSERFKNFTDEIAEMLDKKMLNADNLPEALNGIFKSEK